MTKHEINTIINVEANVVKGNDLRKQIEDISSAGKLLNNNRALQATAAGFANVRKEVAKLSTELGNLQKKYGTSASQGGFALPRGREAVQQRLSHFAQMHGGKAQWESFLNAASRHYSQTSGSRSSRENDRIFRRIAYLQNAGSAYFASSPAQFNVAPASRAAANISRAIIPTPTSQRLFARFTPTGPQTPTAANLQNYKLYWKYANAASGITPPPSALNPAMMQARLQQQGVAGGQSAAASMTPAAYAAWWQQTNLKNVTARNVALSNALPTQLSSIRGMQTATSLKGIGPAASASLTRQQRFAYQQLWQTGAVGKALKKQDARIAANKAVDDELDEFDQLFGQRSTVKSRQAAKLAQRKRQALTQGFLQGLGAPPYLDREDGLRQYAGYLGGRAVYGGARLAGGAAQAVLAGSMQGTPGLVHALQSTAASLPFGLGIPVGMLGGVIGAGHNASQQAMEFRNISNALRAESGIIDARGTGMLSNVGRFYSEQLREFKRRGVADPRAAFSSMENLRRQSEEDLAGEAYDYAPGLGMNSLEYARKALAFQRAAGVEAGGAPGMRPTAFAVSDFTGMQLESAAKLARFTGGRYGGKFADQALQVDRMAMSSFTMAMQNGLNKSEATKHLEQLTEIFSRTAAGGTQSNIFAASTLLSTSLSRAGLTPETAYGLTGALAQKTSDIAYGAQSFSDLRLLKYFGGLDLSKPFGPNAYAAAIEKMSSGQGVTAENVGRMMRLLVSEGGGGEAGIQYSQGILGQMFGPRAMTLNQTRRLAESALSGKLTTADLDASGLRTALQEQYAKVGDSLYTQKTTETDVVDAGRDLIDAFLTIDSALARSVGSLSAFSDKLERVAGLMSDVGKLFEGFFTSLGNKGASSSARSGPRGGAAAPE